MKIFLITICAMLVSAITSFAVLEIKGSKSPAADSFNFSSNLKAVDGGKTKLMNTAIGGFFFSVLGKEKVEKGYKFDFVLGNRNFSEYQGVKIRVSWGKKPENKDQKPELKSTNFNIGKIGIGRWKNFSLIIPEMDEKNLEIVALSVLGADKILLMDGKQ